MKHVPQKCIFYDLVRSPANPSFSMTLTIDLVSAAFVDYTVYSASYQKKILQGLAHQSFFWYDNDKDHKSRVFVTCDSHASKAVQKLFTAFTPCTATKLILIIEILKWKVVIMERISQRQNCEPINSKLKCLCFDSQAMRKLLSLYLSRFSSISGNMINCGTVLNWLEVSCIYNIFIDFCCYIT